MARRFSALAVHNQPEALGELSEILSGPELMVDTARSATEARHKLAANPYAVVISAHRPPDLDGLGLLEIAGRLLPDAWRVLMVNDPAAAADIDQSPAGEKTIVRFVGTPGERSRLAALIGEGLSLIRLIDRQRSLLGQLESQRDKLKRRETLLDVVVKERTKGLEEACEQLKIANRQALFGLAEAIEAKDPYTKGHCGRVAGYTLILAQEAGYPEDDLETLEFGAFLHDIGKIGVRDAVLLKPGPLDEEEWLHMRQHPVKGFEIASQVEMLTPMLPAVRNHHERWDGKGYPDGIKGADIPLPARMVAIADAYDAMATDRPYKRALAASECDALLRKNASKMFDPDLVEIFCARGVGALYREDD
ncbi:MAG TPA: HD domain-containing phosphohydrolase [Kofleriaceae bacterium]|nr:HD domain-containing phosphohydrolase [Kofleriaceae bacterium]